ncbi:hypothetical protein AOQ87_01160 [Candidatus Riesia pediculischaeffi]|uniref:Ancillary SecYEG translocon subunit/Cell division coordinator CpoB TPR domain-containing protein n=2 Tax=Candidatus Riesia pediculischaeffi TaxID=428411 RepID=A0A1V0HKD4_9ENTR|nr:hypothetical protein AOQ87_01160 [Candidatus Riesia pediculischaeffi]
MFVVFVYQDVQIDFVQFVESIMKRNKSLLRIFFSLVVVFFSMWCMTDVVKIVDRSKDSTISTMKKFSRTLMENFERIRAFLFKKKDVGEIFHEITLASDLVKRGNLNRAEEVLSKVVRQFEGDCHLKDLINLRIARIQIALNKVEESMNTLRMIKGESLRCITEELNGDALMKKKSFKKARLSYEESLKFCKIASLKMKIENKISTLFE